MKNWDYGSNGAYFITICTQNRTHFFGEIVNGNMVLNELGVLANQLWMKIPEYFAFIELGNFVIMPNHIHGILIINKINSGDVVNNANIMATDRIETRLIASLPKTGGITGNHNPMLQENISRIVRWYKGRCSFEMRKIHADFGWQSRFYDHIIRDSISFENIQNYIENNPSNWKEDRFYR